MSKPFPFVTDGIHGDVPINFYATQDSERQVLLDPSPGLANFATLTSCTELRGLYAWGDYMFAVTRRGTKSPVFRVNTLGAAAEIGEIDTSYTGKVTFTNNTTQLGICDGVTEWVYAPASGSLVKVADAVLTSYAGIGGITGQDGYGIMFGTGADSLKWFFTLINDITQANALDVYGQRARNDDILAVKSHRQQLWFIGKKAYEIWYDAGGDNTSADNPTFALYKDGVYDVGIIAPSTLVELEGAGLCWLSNRKDLIMPQGTAPVAISHQMFSREIATYSTIEDANAFSYVDEGHTFVQINFPTADRTWVYDATTKSFHKKQSRKTDHTFGRHRANCYAHFNGKHYVGDYANGKIYEMSTAYYDDAGEPIRRELYTPLDDQGINSVRRPPVMLICEPGVGLQGERNPQVMMRYSNNGHTFSNELWRGVGKIGEYDAASIWWRLGSSRRRQYHFAMTYPVLWRVLGFDNGATK